MFRKILLGMGLFGLSIASAKSYNVTLSEQYSFGTAELRAGDYKLVVKGGNAILADTQGKPRANGTVKTEPRKFEDTGIVSTNANGMPHLEAIELRGTRLQVEFK